MLNRGPFSIEVSTRDGVVVKRDKSKLQLSAAETDTLLNALSTVMRIESYPLLPNKLSVPPFIIKFFENRTMEVVRQENLEYGLPFRFEEGDDLIWIVQQGKAHYLANNKPITGLKSPPMPDPVG